MLTMEEAKNTGIKACIEKLGYDFVKKYADTFTPSYGFDDEVDSMYCFVGVDDQPQPIVEDTLPSLTHDPFPYSASCYVSMKDGSITFLDCTLPEQA